MRRTATLFLAALILVACGFQPRGTLPQSIEDKSLAITGLSSGSSLYRQFVAKLQLGHGKLARKPSEANVILHILKQRHIRRPITLSQLGRANMFDLSYLVEFELLGQKALVLAPARELAIHREYFNTQLSPLAQGLEEQQIRSEMEAEASSTLLRQVASLLDHPPEPPHTRAEDEEPESDASSPAKGSSTPATPDSSAPSSP